MATIHPSSVVDPNATLEDGVVIGPFCTVGPKVFLGKNVTLLSHISVDGRTHIGEGTTIYPFASIGHPPQDLKFGGEESELIIGKHNTIREHVTMNPGTQGGGMVTTVGDHCLFMVGSHVAHDCRIGNRVILANNATLAGHVVVGDHAIIGGLAAIHQFVRIGHNAIIGGMSGVEKDVIPYGSVMGERADLSGLNLIGLKRANIDREEIHALRGAFKMLFDATQGTLQERVQQVRQSYQTKQVSEVLDFLESDSSRSFCTPKQGVGAA